MTENSFTVNVSHVEAQLTYCYAVYTVLLHHGCCFMGCPKNDLLPKFKCFSQWLREMQGELYLLQDIKKNKDSKRSTCLSGFTETLICSLTCFKCVFLTVGAEKCPALFPPFPSCNTCTWICSRAEAIWTHLHVSLLPHFTHEVSQPVSEGYTYP